METSDMASTLAEATRNSEPPPPRPSRALLAAVIIMGVMIIFGTATLVGVIIYRISHHVPAVAPHSAPAVMPSLAASSSLSGPALLTVPRHAGEQIAMVSARADGTLAVTLKDEQGNVRILLWNPEQARLIAELTVAVPPSP